MARSSRISSGSTSRVPLGIGTIIASHGNAMLRASPRPPRALSGVRSARRLRDAQPPGVSNRVPLDLRAEGAQALIDPLVPAVDLPHVADLALALGAERGDQHRHAG